MAGDFRRKLASLIGAGSESGLDFDQQRKIVMISILILAGSIFIALLAGIAMFEGLFSLFILDVCMAVILIGHYTYLWVTQDIHRTAFSGCVIVLIFFIVLFASVAANQQAWVWIYTYPIISLFLLGHIGGTVLSMILLGVMAGTQVFGEFLPFYTPYPEGLVLRIALSYLLVFLFSYIFERTRVIMHEQLNRAMQDLNERAIRDGLTGLHNRRYMDEVLDSILLQRKRSGDQLALLMSDVDYFKFYNDTYGHLMGDDVLNQIAEILNGLIRRKSDYIFRYGGEEFVMVLAPTNPKTAEVFAASIIQQMVSAAVPHKKSPLGIVTVSVGVAVSSAEAHIESSTLISAADKALYSAKKTGKNRYVVNSFLSSLER